MQNRTDNMDNKLRQLENQSLPDLSKQDKHWQDMKQMLAPAATPVKPAAKTGLWKWFMAAGTAIAIFWVAGELFTADNKDKNIVTHTTKTETIPAKETTTATDTGKIIPKYDTASYPAEASAAPLAIGIKPQLPPKDRKVASIVTPPCPKCNTDWLNDPLPDTTATKQTPPQTEDAKATLAAFFAQLEKPSQEFVIDGKRDTVLHGADGTALLIPANTFNTNQKVTVVLKEYYSYEDIITNKLTTTSNCEQLVSGGMIHLSAYVNNQPVSIPQSKYIRWFLPDTSAAMEEMQLFMGTETNAREAVSEAEHSVTASQNSSINWQQTSNRFSRNYITTKVKVLDLRDMPFKTASARKYKGYFFHNKKSGLSKEELKKQIREKYGYYDKVIIAGKRKRKVWAPPALSFEGMAQQSSETYYSIGDTAWVRPIEAKIYKLPALDTITFTNRSSTVQSTPALNAQLKKVTDRYSIDINTFGWINCDKFLGKERKLVDYVVNIGDSASNYYTFIAFDKIKSMMAGLVGGTKVIFTNVPEGESAKIISIGVKGGVTVSAIESVKISSGTYAGLKFKATTPAAFKEQAASMDK